MKEQIYVLKHPFTWDNSEVKEVKVTRPKGKHIKKLGASAKLEDLMGIAHHISDFTDRFYDEMDAEDYIGVSEVISNFLDSGR